MVSFVSIYAAKLAKCFVLWSIVVHESIEG